MLNNDVLWQKKCLIYLFETGSGNRTYGSGVGHKLSVVSVDASGIDRDLVVQSENLSTDRLGEGREERDLSVGKSGIKRGYSGS